MKRSAVLATAFAAVLLAAGCDDKGAANAPPPGAGAGRPVEVGIITMKSQAVPRTVKLPGRAVALATAEIRPQVDGIVRRVVFEEGRSVRRDDILYELEPRKFQAALGAAQATLKKAEAAAQGANDTLERNRQLARNQAVSAQTVQDAETALLQAQAEVDVARADVETAQINLDNATIRAPISGIIGKSAITIGALVTANQTDSLATIRQLDPINVDLVDSSANMLRIRAQVQAGTLGRSHDGPPKVTLQLENGQPFGHEGTVALADAAVSESTGSFTIRAAFPNPDRMLLPGMFVQATIDIGQTPGAFMVPQRAVTRNASGEATAWFVSADGKAQTRVLKTEAAIGNDWLVTSGVTDGDRLIVDGLQKISEGIAVNPVAVTLDENGVARQEIAK